LLPSLPPSQSPRRRPRRALHLLILAIVASSATDLAFAWNAPSAFAGEESASDKADRLFREGREAMKRGNPAQACPKFAESQRLDPAPGTLINLSECEEVLGKLTEAWRHIQQAAQQLPKDDDRLPIAREQAESLDRRIPRLTVTLRANAPASSVIMLDGTERVTPGTTIVVDPGSHVVAVSARGYRTTMASVRVAESERAQISVAPEPMSADTPPALPSAPGSTRKILGWTLGAVGVAGLVTGGVLASVLNRKQTIVFAHCEDKICDQEGYDTVRSARRLEPYYYGAWIAGGVGVGLGAVLLLTAPGKPRANVSASVLPGGALLSFSGGLW
jgi:hypothetical protein